MADTLTIDSLSDILALRGMLGNQDRDDVFIPDGGVLLSEAGAREIYRDFSVLQEQAEALVEQKLYLELLGIIWHARPVYILRMRALAEHEHDITEAKSSAPTETGEDFYLAYERWDDARAAFFSKVTSGLSEELPCL